MPFFLVLVTVNWNGSAANLCGIAMVDAARLTFENTVLRQFTWPVMSKKQATVSDDYIHAKSLMIPGSILDNSGYRQETLHHLERAKLMRINTLSSDTYYWITLVHYHENRPWTLQRRHESFLNQAQNSFMFGIILCSANRDTEAWKIMEISLTNSFGTWEST